MSTGKKYSILDNYRVISYSLLILYVAYTQFGSGHLIKMTRENMSYVIMVKRLSSNYVSPNAIFHNYELTVQSKGLQGSPIGTFITLYISHASIYQWIDSSLGQKQGGGGSVNQICP